MSTRSIWKGTLNFGLVSMPVKLHTATSSKTVRFHQLHATDKVRIQTKRVCPADQREVSFEELVRGYEIAPDHYVVVNDEELEALAPEATRTIEIEDFVDLEEIDPIYFDHPYYVTPSRGGAKSYKLLLQVLRETGKVAIARVVLRSRERLVAVRPYDEALLMTTMVFGDEVRATSELSDLDSEVEVGSRELKIARDLVESLSERFESSRYRDTYREAVLDLIDRKASGEEIVVQPPHPEKPQESPDLVSALQASLKDVRKRAPKDGAKPKKNRPAKRVSLAGDADAKSNGAAKPKREVASPPRSNRRGAGDPPHTHHQRRH
jgi:DNA end-binding protein Ku